MLQPTLPEIFKNNQSFFAFEATQNKVIETKKKTSRTIEVE